MNVRTNPGSGATTASLATSDVEIFYDAVSVQIPMMRRVAGRLAHESDADDIVQEALLNAWRKREQFDPSRGSLGAWLAAITAHEATRLARRFRPRSTVSDRQLVPDVEAALDLKDALGHLPRRQRMAVDLFYFAGLSTSDTAVAMGCSEGTVKSTLSDARERLRRLLR